MNGPVQAPRPWACDCAQNRSTAEPISARLTTLYLRLNRIMAWRHFFPEFAD
jgi:hypothetical protein